MRQYPSVRSAAADERSIVAGALNGRLADAFAKLAVLHAKNDFAFALLLGDVFAVSTPSGDDDAARAVDALLRGEISVPLPTYFALGRAALPAAVAARVERHGGEVCENLFFLGKKGSIKTSNGVRIVAVGGSRDPIPSTTAATTATTTTTTTTTATDAAFCTAAEVHALKAVEAADVLLSTEWPAGIECGASTVPAARPRGGSGPIAELAHLLRPRYHFVPGGDVFWEREPYRNAPRGSGSGDDGAAGPLSRFYALGDWGNAAKQKALFAFSLDVSQPPATAAALVTASPYRRSDPAAVAAQGSKRSASSSFFWGDHTSSHDRQRHGQHQHGKKRARGPGPPRPPPGPESCFFCLSYPQLEKHLIVSIGTESYLATAKGPLTVAATNPPGLPFSAHILIVPLAHSPTLALVEDAATRRAVYAEMHRYRRAVERMLAARAACAAVTFEVRRRRGVHVHWQLVPLPVALLPAAHAAFDAAAQQTLERGFEDGPLVSPSQSPPPSEAREAEPEAGEEGDVAGDGDGDAFTYWTSGAHRGRVLRLAEGEFFDLQFGRRVLASALGGGAAGRLNWRECVLGMEEETRDAAAFKAAFREWDFSLDE